MTDLSLDLVEAAFYTVFQNGFEEHRHTLLLDEIPVYARNPDGSLSLSARPRLSWGVFVNVALEASKSLPAVAHVLEGIQRRMPTEGAVPDPERLLAGFMVAVLELGAPGLEMPTPSSLKEALATAYRDLEAILARCEFKVSHISPVTGIQPTTVVHIAPGIVLCPADDEVRQTAWERLGSGPTRLGWSDSTINAVDNVSAELRLEATMKIGEWVPWDKVQHPVLVLLDALRLCSSAPIYSPGNYTMFTPWDALLRRVYPTGTGRPLHLHERSLTATSIPLGSSEAELLVRTYENLRSVSGELNEHEAAAFDVALQRFRDTYERHTDNDRVLDAWIGLEALFLTKDEIEGISYRACMRIARFLGSDGKERRLLFDLLRRSYSLRSRLAHGATARERQKYEPIRERAEEVLDILRRAMRQWIEPSTRRSAQKLDDWLLDTP